MTGSVEEEILELRARYRSHLDPSGRGFVPLADALRRAGRLDEADAVVAEGLAALPDFSAGHLVAAWVHRDRGDLDGAQAALREVLRLDPLNVLALRHLARFREDAGDAGEAGQLMERAAGVDGGAGEQVDAEILAVVAPTLPVVDEMAEGDEATGVTEAEPAGSGGASEWQPEEAAFLPTVELPGGDLPDANPDWFVESWSEAEEEEAEEPPFPGEGVHTRTMAELYASQGLLDRAVEVYEELVELDPGNEELTTRLAELVERRRQRRAQGHEVVAADVEATGEAVPEAEGAGEAVPEAEGAGEAVPEADSPPEAAFEGTKAAGDEGAVSGIEVDAEDTEATLHLPTGGDLVESPFSWTSPTAVEPGDGAGTEVPVAGFFQELLSWVPGGVEGEGDVGEAEPVGVVEEIDVAVPPDEAVDVSDEFGVQGEVEGGSGTFERVGVEFLGPEVLEPAEAAAAAGGEAIGETTVESAWEAPSGAVADPAPEAVVEPLPPAPWGSPDNPVAVEDLAPDGEVPRWVPVESLAPDGPLPAWVPISELAPDPLEREEPSPTLDAPPPPDASDDEFRAWLERLRL